MPQAATKPYQAINLAQKFGLIDEQWSPRVVAELNDYQFKLSRIEGDFVWHDHPETDEAFLVLEGELRIDFRDGQVLLRPGELFVVPRRRGAQAVRRKGGQAPADRAPRCTQHRPCRRGAHRKERRLGLALSDSSPKSKRDPAGDAHDGSCARRVPGRQRVVSLEREEADECIAAALDLDAGREANLHVTHKGVDLDGRDAGLEPGIREVQLDVAQLNPQPERGGDYTHHSASSCPEKISEMWESVWKWARRDLGSPVELVDPRGIVRLLHGQMRPAWRFPRFTIILL